MMRVNFELLGGEIEHLEQKVGARVFDAQKKMNNKRKKKKLNFSPVGRKDMNYSGNFGVGFVGGDMMQQRTEFMHFAKL